MAKVELKQPIVEEISGIIKDAASVVLVNYSGLTVEQDTIIRKELREAGVQYKVYKNTMMKRAFGFAKKCQNLPKETLDDLVEVLFYNEVYRRRLRRRRGKRFYP